MEKFRIALLVLLSAVLGLWFPGVVVAHNLAAPTGVSCTYSDVDTSSSVTAGDLLDVDWTDPGFDTDGDTLPDSFAGKFSVDVIAGYDLDGDTVVDATIQLSFGTSDRTDSLPLSDPSLDILVDSFITDINSDTVTDIPVEFSVVVKGLHRKGPAAGQGHPFSALTVCTSVP